MGRNFESAGYFEDPTLWGFLRLAEFDAVSLLCWFACIGFLILVGLLSRVPGYARKPREK